jgi:hypothetical protein
VPKISKIVNKPERKSIPDEPSGEIRYKHEMASKKVNTTKDQVHKAPGLFYDALTHRISFL